MLEEQDESVTWLHDPREGAIVVTGSEARSWLNGQISQVMPEIGEARPSFVLNSRGRILADVVVQALDAERLRLLVSLERRPTLLEHLNGHLIMEDAELATEDLRVLSLQGPAATKIADALPEAERLPRRRLGAPSGVDLLVAAEELEAAAEQLAAAGAQSVDERGWGRLCAELGIPRFGVDYDETRMPQETGTHRDRVSFDKGCYIGQEVVCTLEHRGKLSRRLVRVRGSGLSVGGLRRDDREVGLLTSLTGSDGKQVGLAMLRGGAAEIGVELRQDEGGRATVFEIVGEGTGGSPIAAV